MYFHKLQHSREILKKFTDGYTILKQNCVEDTPLHWAYKYGDDQVIRMLEKHPEFTLAVGIKNRLGETSLNIRNSRSIDKSSDN